MKRAIDKVGLALVNDGKVLLARNRGTDKFQIPGGKVEAQDKDDYAALVREIQEELQVTLSSDSVRHAGVFSDKAEGQQDRLVNVKLYISSIVITPVASSEIEELRWFLLSDSIDREFVSAVVGRQIIPFLRDLYLVP